MKKEDNSMLFSTYLRKIKAEYLNNCINYSEMVYIYKGSHKEVPELKGAMNKMRLSYAKLVAAYIFLQDLNNKVTFVDSRPKEEILEDNILLFSKKPCEIIEDEKMINFVYYNYLSLFQMFPNKPILRNIRSKKIINTISKEKKNY